MDQNQTSQTNSPPVQTPQTNRPKSGGKSNVVLIVAIILMVFIILGIGGYFAYKFIKTKYLATTGTTSTVATKTASSSGKVSIKSVLETLMYPGSTIYDQKQGGGSAYIAEMTLNSNDSVDTIKNYYLALTEKNNWKISAQGSNGANNYSMTIAANNFTDELDITKYDGYDYTDIRHLLDGDSLVADGIYIPSASTSATVSSSTTANTTSSSSDYIISDSSSRVISRSELLSLSPWQLKVARNEIYARYGRPFVHKDMQCYFAQKSWYKSSDSFTESMLSTTDNKNVATIQAYEQETSSPLASSDSGCNTNN